MKIIDEIFSLENVFISGKAKGGKNVKRSEAIFNQRLESKIFDDCPQ